MGRPPHFSEFGRHQIGRIRPIRPIFPCPTSRANTLRVRFQEVARTAGRVIGVAYGPRTNLLLLFLGRGLGLACLALIAASVAGTAAERGEDRRRGQNEKCMSHVRCSLLETTSGGITPRIQKNVKTVVCRKIRTFWSAVIYYRFQFGVR